MINVNITLITLIRSVNLCIVITVILSGSYLVKERKEERIIKMINVVTLHISLKTITSIGWQGIDTLTSEGHKQDDSFMRMLQCQGHCLYVVWVSRVFSVFPTCG